MTAPLPPWDDRIAWRRRVVDHGRPAMLAWLAAAGGVVGPKGYRLPADLPESKAREWLEASLADHEIPKEPRP